LCVIIAKKINNIWNLFKLRDRKYDPKYIIKDYNVNNIELTYLLDKKSKWLEGINSNGITLVSAALDNHADASITNNAENSSKADKLFQEYLKKTNQRNYEILKRILRQPNIEDALNVLVESKFIGNTFLTDGNKLYSIEIAIPQAKLLQYKEENDEFKDLSFKEFKAKIMNNLSEDDFKVSVVDSSDKELLVKTNHSIRLRNLGYVKGQKGYKSSVKRREIVISYMKKLKNLSTEEIVYQLYNLDLPKIHYNPEYRPLRTKEKINLDDKLKQKFEITSYYTTDIFGINPEKRTIYILPLHSKILNYGNYINKNTKTHIIVLNKNIFLESYKETIFPYIIQ